MWSVRRARQWITFGTVRPWISQRTSRPAAPCTGGWLSVWPVPGVWSTSALSKASSPWERSVYLAKNKWSPVSKSALDIMFACFRLYMWQPHSLTWCWLFSSSVPPHCLELLMDWCTSSLLKWVWSLASTSGDLYYVSQAQWPDVLGLFFLLSL